MPQSIEDDLICNVIASAYHVTVLVYDAAGALLASAPPHCESDEEIFSETGCQERLFQLCHTHDFASSVACF